MARDYGQTGVSQTSDFIHINVSGKDNGMYQIIGGQRSPIPTFTGYIDSASLEEDSGNAAHNIKPGYSLILLCSATDPTDDAVKTWKLKVRADYTFATPRFVNVLAGQVSAGDNRITVSFYNKEKYRSLFCSISVKG